MKNWKTSLVGIFGMIVFLIAMILVYLGKASFTEVASGLSFIAVFLTALAAIFAKDYDKSGTK